MLIQSKIIRPRLKALWTLQVLPSLRSSSGAVQTALMKYGNLGLRLKLNSHWIFSDIACSLCPGQPGSFLLKDEQTLDEIDPLVGLSPRLLNIYADVTRESLTAQSIRTQSGLHDRLSEVIQHMPPRLKGLPEPEHKVLEDIAKAYLHGAHIYFLCRHERYVDIT